MVLKIWARRDKDVRKFYSSFAQFEITDTVPILVGVMCRCRLGVMLETQTEAEHHVKLLKYDPVQFARQLLSVLSF